MTSPIPIDLARLRRSCSECSLQQLCLPAGIDGADLGQLDAVVRERRPIQRGERLFRTGEAMSSVYVTSAGAFKTVCITEAGDEHVLGFHLPGELFGLDAVGTGRHRCEAVALADSRVCELPFNELAAAAALLPSLQRQLLRVMGQSSDLDHDHVDVLSRRHASERIALFLHGLGQRYRRIGMSAEAFQLPMTRDEIARYLGLALETVSRSFSRLHEEGVIEVSGRRVRILDAPALHDAASGCEADHPRGESGHARG